MWQIQDKRIFCFLLFISSFKVFATSHFGSDPKLLNWFLSGEQILYFAIPRAIPLFNSIFYFNKNGNVYTSRNTLKLWFKTNHILDGALKR